MFNIKNGLSRPTLKQIAGFTCRNVSNKEPPPRCVDIDSQEMDPTPSYWKEIVNRKQKEPFSEIKEDSIFTALVKSLAPQREGPPSRVSWNANTFTIENAIKTIKRRKREYDIFQQRFIPKRHEQLGNEIAAAHFIVFRSGSIKFYNCDYWIKMKKGDDIESYDQHLPKKFEPSVFIECINATDVQLYYEGLKNLQRLAQVRWISFRNNQHFDDWCLDKITNEYKTSLEYLDIGNCKKVTYRGLVALCKIQNLSTLNVEGISDSIEFQLSCLMLQDEFPNLKIVGVKYSSVDDAVNANDNISVNYNKSSSSSSSDNLDIKNVETSNRM